MSSTLKKVLAVAWLSALAGCSKSKPEAVAALAAPAAVTAPLNPTRDAVMALLGAYEREHGDAQTWKQLGPPAKTVLRELLADPAHRGDSVQMRAAEALGFLADPGDVELLTGLAADEGAPRTLRMGALTGLTLALGKDATAVLAGYLAYPEPGLRSRAVDLLGGLGTAEARAALAAAAPGGDQALQRRITRALR